MNRGGGGTDNTLLSERENDVCFILRGSEQTQAERKTLLQQSRHFREKSKINCVFQYFLHELLAVSTAQVPSASSALCPLHNTSSVFHNSSLSGPDSCWTGFNQLVCGKLCEVQTCFYMFNILLQEPHFSRVNTERTLNSSFTSLLTDTEALGWWQHGTQYFVSWEWDSEINCSYKVDVKLQFFWQLRWYIIF